MSDSETHAERRFGGSCSDAVIPVEQSFVGVLGLDIDPPGEEIGRLSGRLPVTDAVCQPMGIVHGGVYAAIAETLASMGTATRCGRTAARRSAWPTTRTSCVR